jgi:hypothetical protein
MEQEIEIDVRSLGSLSFLFQQIVSFLLGSLNALTSSPSFGRVGSLNLL